MNGVKFAQNQVGPIHVQNLKVFSLWDGDPNQLPKTVDNVFRRWRHMVGEENFVVIDGPGLEENLKELDIVTEHLAVQAKSDLLRLKLLRENGGIWVDASLFPTQHPDQWLGDMMAPSGFFAFSRPGPDRLISSWFLAAEKGHPLIEAWLEAVCAYFKTPRYNRQVRGRFKKLLQNRKRFLKKAKADPVWSIKPDGGGATPYYPYFWLHYYFNALAESDSRVRETWADTPRLSADPCHLIQRIAANATSEELDAMLPGLVPLAPVHKLVWRKEWPDILWNYPLTDEERG